MANTYTQLYIHVVFSVKGRSRQISTDWKEELYRYISGIIKYRNQKLMIIGGMGDHIHILIGFHPACVLSDLVRDIKSNSSKWVNENRLATGRFEWQTGYGAFTIGQSQVDKVISYIKNQEAHHSNRTFHDEYLDFLKAYKVEYNPEYVFDD
jgi:putative transposase